MTTFSRARLSGEDGLLLGLLLIAGVALRFWVGAHPLDQLYASGIVIDDAYYAFSYAREFAEGRPYQVGPGQVGNGFQPLYVFLIVPAFAAFDGETAIRLALLLTGAASVATAMLLARWLHRLGAGSGAVFAAGVWLLSTPAVVHGLNGLETSLNLMILAAIGAFWPSLRERPLLLGLTLALALLARVDNLLLLAVVGIAFALDRRAAPPHLARGAFAIAAGCLAGLVPYVASSLAYTGEPLPHSGRAMHTMSQYGSPESWLLFHPALIGSNLLEAATALWSEGVQHLLPGPLSVGVAVCAALWLALLAPGLARLGSWDPRASILLPLVAAAALWIGAYTSYIGGVWFYPRYFHGALLLLTLCLGLLAGRAAASRPKAARAVGVLLLLVYGSLSWRALDVRLDRREFRNHEWLPYIERAFDKGERIGMFQSGWTGYHTRGAVINLDGVVNPHALDAIIERRLDRYLDERHISLIIDWPWVAEGIVRSRSDASRVLLRAIHDDGYFTVYRYRSRDPAAGQAAP